MNKKILSLLFGVVVVLFLVGCARQETAEDSDQTAQGSNTEIQKLISVTTPEENESTSSVIPNNLEEASKPEKLIGYMGCSITIQTVEGYQQVGGVGMWSPDQRFDDGSVMNWANPRSRWWDAFDANIEKYPETSIIWWQLCIPAHENPTYSDAGMVIDMIKSRLPDAIIYVSSLAPYGHACEASGATGVTRGQQLAEQLLSKGSDVKLGPIFNRLTIRETENDQCHLNDAGREHMGKELKHFFDNLDLENLSGEDDNYDDEANEPAPASAIEKYWENRIQDALAPVACTTVSGRRYGELYYDGILIDTHVHISPLEGGPPEGESLDHPPDESPDDEADQVLSLGVNHRIGDITCTLKNEGTKKVFAFFPVFREMPRELTEVAKRTMEQYPNTFIPFIGTPDNDGSPDGFPTVDAPILQSMLEIEPGLFKGYGEIGLYARGDHGGPRGAPALSPDSKRLQEIYPVIREHNLVVYFHLGEGQKESFGRVLQQNPDLNFIFHGDQLVEDGSDLSQIGDLLGKYPNVYYGVDELYGDVWLLRPDVTKEEFLAHFENYKPLLEKDVRTWKRFIERHPDQVLWGTDRGGPTWSIDPEVGLALTNYARAFIARLDPSVQEKFAYKNAERLIEMSGEDE